MITLALAATLLVSQLHPAAAQTATTTADPWQATGSSSFYWHNRYHALLAMSAYGDYNTTCPQTFTAATLETQYPGNTNTPFQILGSWGPTPIYKSEGYMVKVPEMNKILMVFKGNFGWENFNATLSPFTGIGCDSTCKAHTAALGAWAEVKAETSDMQAIKDNQGSLVFSSSGHGWGGMVAQVGALDLKYRGFLYSCQTFGSPPVFNQAAASLWSSLFPQDDEASMRTIANDDSVPTLIPIGDYAFVETGIHVYGTNATYGQSYYVCEDSTYDPECVGGSTEADHYFYYTNLGHCGEEGYTESLDESFDYSALASDQAAYNATATAPLLSVPNTSIIPATVTSSTIVSSSSIVTSTITAVATATAAPDVASTAVSISSAATSTRQISAAGIVEVGRTLAVGAVLMAGMTIGMGLRFA